MVFVDLKGDISFMEKKVNAVIQFKFNDDDTFEFFALEFNEIAKIGTKQFGFCSEECYREWLLNPAAQFLAPINVKLLASYLRDNPQ